MTTRPLRALGFLAFFAAASTLPACTGTQSAAPQNSPGAAPAAFEVDHAGWRTIGYRWEWTSRPPRTRDGVITFADAYDDLLIVQDSGAMVSVIEAPTGRIRWNKQAAQTNTRFLGNARRDGSVFVTNETELFEFDLQSGNTINRIRINDIATTSPVFFGNRAVLGTAAGRVVCIDTRNNLRVWEYQFDGLMETPPLAIDENRVAAVSTLGDIRTLFVDTANTESSARISGDAGDLMATDGEFLFVASLDQSVYAFDIADGTRLWRLRTSAPVTVRPVVIDDTLFVTTADTGLAAIDVVSGEIRWSNTSIGGWVVSTNDGNLMVWNGAELMRVDAERGDLIARTRLESLAGVRADRQEEGNLYAISHDGAVAKFSPQ